MNRTTRTVAVSAVVSAAMATAVIAAPAAGAATTPTTPTSEWTGLPPDLVGNVAAVAYEPATNDFSGWVVGRNGVAEPFGNELPPLQRTGGGGR